MILAEPSAGGFLDITLHTSVGIHGEAEGTLTIPAEIAYVWEVTGRNPTACYSLAHGIFSLLSTLD
eukprot:6212540-Pleurochrysis_carterae.AAC.2